MSECPHGQPRVRNCGICRIEKLFGSTTTGGEASQKKGKEADN